MDRKLQDLVWSCLPKEFKEEVKYEYSRVATKVIKTNYDLGFMNAHEGMYGIHNLTSDAEGEEILTISCKRVQEMYAATQLEGMQQAEDVERADHYAEALRALFGEKCLPDNVDSPEDNVDSSNGSVDSLDPNLQETEFKEGDIVRYRYDRKLYIVEGKTGKYHYALRQYDCNITMRDVLESDLEPYPEQEVKRHVSVKEACEILGVDESEATKLVKSEPKFKVGEHVRVISEDKHGIHSHIIKIDKEDNGYFYTLEGVNDWRFFEQNLEPYTAPQENPNPSNSGELKSQEADKQFDNILKDSFSKERRLSIAAMAMQGLMCNPYGFTLDGEDQDKTPESVAEMAFLYADALIARAEKGGAE